MSGQPLKMAVVGVGYLGRFHAQKLARNPEVELVAVVDKDRQRAQEVARQHNAQALYDHRQAVELVEAASIVTPTETHFEVSADFLAAGKDLLVEKPICASLEDADRLVALAQENRRIVQVGHLERYNPAVEETVRRVRNPRFIECNRIAPFKGRATDVDVALDLMIHDLDIILALVGCQPSEIRAHGVPVLGPHADIVNTRLEFPTGCVANVTASRLALKDERKMRIFQSDAYLSLDFRKRRLVMVQGVEYRPGKKPKVKAQRPRFGKSDPLARELADFVRVVKERQEPRVSGLQARQALACALEVRERVQENLKGAEELLVASRNLVDCKLPS